MRRVINLVNDSTQKAWLKLYIDVNVGPRKKNAQINFQKDFYRLMNNAVFGRTMKNERNHRNIKLKITKARRNFLVSEPNYHTLKAFSDNLLAIK